MTGAITGTSDSSVADRLAAEALIVDVDGFEGPLDLLLTLSRTQKVDLRKISVLQLARRCTTAAATTRPAWLCSFHTGGARSARA